MTDSKKTNKTAKSAPAANSQDGQIQELHNKLLRSLADYANLEKRIDSQRGMLITFATANILNKIVPVLDDFNLAQTHLKDAGLQIAIDKFKQVLRGEGVNEINPINQPFNAELMTCVDTKPGQDNHVLEVTKVGYQFMDQVIRPAEVIVGKDVKPEPAS